jgi:pimeloyl-ACP methyl ester carboxylesterase
MPDHPLIAFRSNDTFFSAGMPPGQAPRMPGAYLVEGAGHRMQQEQPGEVSRLLLQFLDAATV